MSPLHKTLLTAFYGLFGVTFPFLLGRFSKSTRCVDCDRRSAASRARRNGEFVAAHRARTDLARLKQRASSPDDVRAQALADRRSLRDLISPCGFCGGLQFHDQGCGHLDRLDAPRRAMR